MDACADFGISSDQSNYVDMHLGRRVAMYLGQRSFGDGTPYTGECMSSCRRTVLKLMRSCLVVVVSLGNATHQRWDKAPAREFQEPPSLAEWTNTVRNPIPHATAYSGTNGPLYSRSQLVNSCSQSARI
jgi:hypothetical protein